MGCLVLTEDKKLCGLTNNHVTGDCNHTEANMHILVPSPMDAMVNGPPPTAVGRHLRLIPLQSGNPGQSKAAAPRCLDIRDHQIQTLSLPFKGLENMIRHN